MKLEFPSLASIFLFMGQASVPVNRYEYILSQIKKYKLEDKGLAGSLTNETPFIKALMEARDIRHFHDKRKNSLAFVEAAICDIGNLMRDEAREIRFGGTRLIGINEAKYFRKVGGDEERTKLFNETFPLFISSARSYIDFYTMTDLLREFMKSYGKTNVTNKPKGWTETKDFNIIDYAEILINTREHNTALWSELMDLRGRGNTWQAFLKLQDSYSNN